MGKNEIFDLFATTPKGLELLLVDELRALGAIEPREKLAGVTFKGDLSTAYRAALWSRLANRILLPLVKVPAATPEELYKGVQMINWDQHLDSEGTLNVHFISSNSNITHTLFGAQKVKDAIVDQMRDKFGVRPSVSRSKPDISIYVYLQHNEATISLDLSGESLHKRGYREEGGSAPLKENLAAAILIRAGWPQIAKVNGALHDPMCGSATLLIEAALIAADIAPGLSRDYFGFLGWKKHQAKLWQTLITEAEQRKEKGLTNLPTIVGYDEDAYAIKIAFENIESANLLGKIHVERRELAAFVPKANVTPGLVVTNPPYGERLGDVEELKPLYSLLGERLKEYFQGWHAAVFTGNPDLGKVMGLRAKKFYALYNGAIPCKLLLFNVEPEFFVDRSEEADNERRVRSAQRAVTENSQVQMFVNRLNKNLRHIRKQLKKEPLSSYRVYDADIPEYAFAVDIENDSVQVMEYEAPRGVKADKVVQRRQEVLAVLPEILEIPANKIFFKIVERKK